MHPAWCHRAMPAVVRRAAALRLLHQAASEDLLSPQPRFANSSGATAGHAVSAVAAHKRAVTTHQLASEGFLQTRLSPMLTHNASAVFCEAKCSCMHAGPQERPAEAHITNAPWVPPHGVRLLSGKASVPVHSAAGLQPLVPSRHTPTARAQDGADVRPQAEGQAGHDHLALLPHTVACRSSSTLLLATRMMCTSARAVQDHLSAT